jgi:hypothetical protein
MKLLVKPLLKLLLKLLALTLLPVAFVGRFAWAQDANDAMARLRECSLKTRADRLDCLEKLSINPAPPALPVPEGTGWITSVTTSPVDYSLIATATKSAREDASGSAMQLSIRCRGGRTELAVTGAAISGRAQDYAISYRINGKEPVQVAAAPASGAGIAFKIDASDLVQSLPADGELAVRVTFRRETIQDGTFSLAGLDLVRENIAAACKWPPSVAHSDR